MANYTGRFLREIRNRRDARGLLRPFRRLYYSYYLTAAYVCIKLIYAANVIGQLFLLNKFLGTDYHFYGVDVLRRMAAGEDWTTSQRFPRVTICDFFVRSKYYEFKGELTRKYDFLFTVQSRPTFFSTYALRVYEFWK